MTPVSMGGSRARWTALGLLLLAFVAGALGGVAADRLLGTPTSNTGLDLPRRAGAERPGARPGAIFPAGVQLARELELSPEQRRQIQRILAEEREKADSVMRAVRPLLQARYDSSLQAVREVLTPEQRERFDQLREERRQRIRGRGPRAIP
jgi:Spy/CpxP family protein refolding chaperone